MADKKATIKSKESVVPSEAKPSRGTTTKKPGVVAKSVATKQPRKAKSTVVSSETRVRGTSRETSKKAAEKPVIIRDHYTLDAANQAPGRLATQISIMLRGKNKPTFERHIEAGNFVIVTNAAKMKTTPNKLRQKIYYHHSMYPGGLKKKTMGEVFAKDPAEVLYRTVWNMLPKNKLRDQMIKRLKITN